jgi:thioredoxin reductase
MKDNKQEVIIIGGSYAGLSAAMSLGRALRKVLVIDSGTPCNRQAPYAHNFITHDGETPAQITAAAKAQVLQYPTVSFIDARATDASRLGADFEVQTEDGRTFSSKKLVLATGLTDLMPGIEGFRECWGISVLHCPYCHGYEVRHKRTGILGNSDMGYDYACMLSNWTKDLTLFTNGDCTLTAIQVEKLRHHNIHIVETEVSAIRHKHGNINHLVFSDGTETPLAVLYARPPHIQQSGIAERLGCRFSEHGLIEVDAFHRTTVHGIYAAGDNSSVGRSVAVATAHGSVAGMMLNKEMMEEAFLY